MADIIKINKESQQSLLMYMKAAAGMRDDLWNFRDRLETIDRAYIRENDYTEEQQKAKRANKLNDPTKLQNMKVPLVMESVESTVSFLTNVFLTEYPIFKFGADPAYEDLALMWNTLVGNDQVKFNWAGELIQAMRQGSKYNFAPVEVSWEREIRHVPKNGNGKNGADLKELICEGNRIKSLDAYNTIYDPRVPPHLHHLYGEFGGYIVPMNRIWLKRFLMNLGDDRLKNDVSAFKSADWDVSYYIPQINMDVINNAPSSTMPGQFNWMTWALGNAKSHIEYRDSYTTTILYARIMPFEFGISAPQDNTPAIWKLVAVNGVLVYAQPCTNAHDYLPIIIGCPMVDNISVQSKSQAENQQPFQEMASSMFIAAQNTARRMVTDRMLYNPLLVDPDHINSPNPSAKIPLRPTAYGRKLEEAVYQIPFNSTGTEQFMQQAQVAAQWGMRANGQNLPSLGQFQKGNKLESEWNTTMSNANARERTAAINWESFVFTPMKEIIRSNLLQFAPTGERYNVKERKAVNIDITKLREVVGEFEIGDGLQPLDRKLHTDVLNAAFQFLNGSPGIQQGYEMPDMFAYMMQTAGADKLAQFKKTPEQIQYEQQMGAWQSAVQMISKMKKDEYSIEEIQKIIGPMPKPPGTPQPQQPEVNAPSA